jgi:hypothetical protein
LTLSELVNKIRRLCETHSTLPCAQKVAALQKARGENVEEEEVEWGLMAECNSNGECGFQKFPLWRAGGGGTVAMLWLQLRDRRRLQSSIFWDFTLL